MVRDYIYVTPFFPTPNSWRGAVGYDFAKALAATGRFNVHVFTPGRDFGEWEIGGIKAHSFPVKTLPSAVLPFLFARRNKKNFLEAVRRAGIDFKNVAVCHGNVAFCGVYPLAMKDVNPNCLTLLHHHDPMSFGLTFGRLRHFWPYKAWHFPELRRMHEKIDCHVFISKVVRKCFLAAPDTPYTFYDDYRRQMSHLSFYRPAQIKDSIVVHNGVDTEIFNPAGRKKFPGEPFTIGCIGNFISWKDQETLIRAAGLLKGKTLVKFVGSGPALEGCKQLASAQTNAIFEFSSEMPHEKLPDFYRSLDLFVLPSYCEGFGCVFTEAWACGTPFITCQGQGMDDMIRPEDRDLWLVPPRNPQALAAAIENYIAHRPVQQLARPAAIGEIMQGFVGEIEKRLPRAFSPAN